MPTWSGPNSCIDRGPGTTRVGKGSKIDNLVQVGHNVEIGERVVIAAQTGISGSTVIESDAVIGGQVGFGDHARVLSGAVIGSQAGVLPGKIVRPGVWWGTPVQPLEEYKRLNALWGRLPRMREEIQTDSAVERLTSDSSHLSLSRLPSNSQARSTASAARATPPGADALSPRAARTHAACLRFRAAEQLAPIGFAR